MRMSYLCYHHISTCPHKSNDTNPPLDRKQLILEDAKKRILKNHTKEEIAQSHEISKRTLNIWLIALGEEYQELRRVWIDNMLTEAVEEIDNATDHFPPRAREFKVESCEFDH